MQYQKRWAIAFFLVGCVLAGWALAEYSAKKIQLSQPYMPKEIIKNTEENLKTALFAGGCFWCVESDYEKLKGVKEAVSGYGGGTIETPTYQNHAGHREVAQIIYDPAEVSYATLVEHFWKHVDPTDPGGSFYDRGHAYTSSIFYAEESERKIAEDSKAALEASGRFDKPIVTPIEPLTTFYPAEDYHQDYYKKNPVRYKYYRTGSGRDRFIEKYWGRE